MLVREPKTGTNSTVSHSHSYSHSSHSSAPRSLPPYLPSFPSPLIAQCAPFPPSTFENVPSFFPLAHLALRCRRQLSLYTPSSHIYQMLLRSLAFFLTASASALAQTVYDSAHNVTPITGTWSSGSMNVTTGPVRIFRALFLLALGAHRSSPNRRMYSQTPKRSTFLRIPVSPLHCA